MSRALWLSPSGYCAGLMKCWGWGSAASIHLCPASCWKAERGWCPHRWKEGCFWLLTPSEDRRAKTDFLKSSLCLPRLSVPCMSPSKHLLSDHWIPYLFIVWIAHQIAMFLGPFVSLCHHNCTSAQHLECAQGRFLNKKEQGLCMEGSWREFLIGSGVSMAMINQESGVYHDRDECREPRQINQPHWKSAHLKSKNYSCSVS